MKEKSSVIERGLIEAAYFLSRVGVDKPPSQLKARKWKEAFAKFYGTFGGSKTEEEFHNSLKNLRDHFDSHLENNRAGWLEKDGKTPQPLSSANLEVLLEFQDCSDEVIWSRVKPYATISYDEQFARKQNKKVTKEKAKYFSSEFSGVKDLPRKEVGEAIVNHGLIVDSLKLHIEETNKDALVYNTQKIDLL